MTNSYGDSASRFPDPLAPPTSRFPLAPAGGRVTISDSAPSGPTTRPFGLRFAAEPQIVECAKHEKKPTRKTVTDKTIGTRDGKENSYAIPTGSGGGWPRKLACRSRRPSPTS